MQHNPELNPSIFMISGSQPAGQINLAFTNDEFDEILSAMQSVEPSDIHPSFTDLQRESCDKDRDTKVDDSAVENKAYTNSGYTDNDNEALGNNQAYRNSGYTDNESLNPDLVSNNEETRQGHNYSINSADNAHVGFSSPTSDPGSDSRTNQTIQLHISQIDDMDETTI